MLDNTHTALFRAAFGMTISLGKLRDFSAPARCKCSGFHALALMQDEDDDDATTECAVTLQRHSERRQSNTVPGFRGGKNRCGKAANVAACVELESLRRMLRDTSGRKPQHVDYRALIFCIANTEDRKTSARTESRTGPG